MVVIGLRWIIVTTQSSRTTAPGFPAPRRPRGDGSVAAVATRLVDLRRRLERTDLRPAPDTDAAFGELVGLCCFPPAGCTEGVLAQVAPHSDALRTLAATGEGHMENHWAGRIAAAPDPRAELDRFPYLGNYHDLVRLELAALTAVGLVRKIQPSGSLARYESRVGDNHHHLICRGCGLMFDIDCAVGEVPCLTADDDHGFEIDEAEVIYWGHCPDCRAGATRS